MILPFLFPAALLFVNLIVFFLWLGFSPRYSLMCSIVSYVMTRLLYKKIQQPALDIPYCDGKLKRNFKHFPDSFFFFLGCHILLYSIFRFNAAEALLYITLTLVALTSLKKRIKNAYYLLLFLMIAYGLFLSSQIFSPGRGGATIALSLCVLLLWLFKTIRFSFLSRQNPGIVVWLFVNAFLMMSYINISHGPRETEIQRILSQPDVKAALLYPPHEPGFHGQLIRHAFESCDGKSLFLAANLSWGKPKGLLRVRLPDLQIQDVMPGKLVGDVVEQDCGTGKLYFHVFERGSNKTRVQVVSEKDFKKVFQSYVFPMAARLVYFQVDAARNRVYMASDAGFIVARRSDGKLLRQKYNGGGTSPVLLPDGDLLLLSNLCKKTFFVNTFICRYSYNDNKLHEVGPGYREAFLQVDPKTHTAFFTELFNGFVTFLDIPTGKIKRRIYLEPFVRRLVFDEKSRILTVAGYYKGNLYQIHVDTGKILNKVYIGRRCHQMYLSHDRKGVYAATTQGVFYIRLPASSAP